MSEARIAVLSDRDVVSVRGLDARKLLDSVITNDMDVLDDAPAMFSGLLTPQGKILFDFFVVAANDGFLIDVAASYAADFVKRLTLYRLRAKVEINGPVEGQCVAAIWGPGGGAAALLDGVTAWTDPRDPRLGQRAILPAGEVAIAANIADAQRGSEADHQAHRIGLGVAEGAKDYDFGDTFPHEANFDLLHGVSFEKGCYVGQEIVARMEHRGTVRKRVVRVMGARDLSPGRPNVTMGDVVIGRLGSVAGRTGMALVRLDRAIEAIDKGQAITADGVELNIDAEMIARQRHLMAVKAAST